VQHFDVMAVIARRLLSVGLLFGIVKVGRHLDWCRAWWRQRRTIENVVSVRWQAAAATAKAVEKKRSVVEDW
jgi:hypothetical protein